MKLNPGGREYLAWPLVDVPDAGGLEASFDNGSTWKTMTVVDEVARILVAGPDATGNPGGTTVLQRGFYNVLVRATIAPEVLIRAAGEVQVG